MKDKDTQLIWESYSRRLHEIKDMGGDDWDDFLDYKNKTDTTYPRGMTGTLKHRLKQTKQHDARTSQSIANNIKKQMLSFREKTSEDDNGLQGTALDKFFHAVAERPRKALEQWILLKSQGEKPGMEPGDEELYKIGAAVTGSGVPGSVSSGHIQDDKVKQLEMTAGQHDIQTIDQAKVALRLYKAIENLITMKIEELHQNRDYNVWLSRHVYSDGSVPTQAYINPEQSFDFHETITEPVMKRIKEAVSKGYI